MFRVQLNGKWDRWGRYNLYFEALKGLLLKNEPYFFFLIFAENVTLLSVNNYADPIGASTSKYKKSSFPMWLYEGCTVKSLYVALTF